jgi:hypothetical protein
MDYKSRSSREAHMIINSTSWWTMYIGEAFPKTMHMIQNACNLRYKDSYTSCYICHAKCKKCIKESYTYATKGAPTHQLKKSNKHQTPPANEWKLLDLGVSWKYQLVGHVWVHGSRLSSHSLHSLKKWYLTSMCLVLEWSNAFFAMLMALVLSHWSGTWVYWRTDTANQRGGGEWMGADKN